MSRKQKWLEAIEGFKSILDRVSDPHAVLDAIAACYDGLENYLMAAEFYEKALAVCPESRSSTCTTGSASPGPPRNASKKPSMPFSTAWHFRVTRPTSSGWSVYLKI